MDIATIPDFAYSVLAYIAEFEDGCSKGQLNAGMANKPRGHELNARQVGWAVGYLKRHKLLTENKKGFLKLTKTGWSTMQVPDEASLAHGQEVPDDEADEEGDEPEQVETDEPEGYNDIVIEEGADRFTMSHAGTVTSKPGRFRQVVVKFKNGLRSIVGQLDD